MADEEKKTPAAPTPAPAKAEPLVKLAVIEPNHEFDLSGLDLPVIDRKGVTVTSSQADRIRMVARKHNVLIVELPKD